MQDASPYQTHFRGAKSFSQVYDVLSRLPPKLHLEISHLGDDFGDQADDLQNLFSSFVLHALYRIHTKGMNILESRHAPYSEARRFTLQIDKKYNAILSQWAHVHELIGDDPTLLHRMLSFGECEWEEELLPK